MPQETKQIFDASATSNAYTEGAVISAADRNELRKALDEAFDYRGDVTITLRSGSVVEGYLFDRRSGTSLETSVVRVMPKSSQSLSGEEKITIRYNEIASLSFSGKDTAAGKTWENWVRRYAEKKLKGEAASIEAERLD
jgi:hypothetical protein